MHRLSSDTLIMNITMPLDFNEYDVALLTKYLSGDPYGTNIADSGGHGSYPTYKNTNYILRVEIQGNTFRCFINGIELFSGTDDTYHFGKVGLRAHRAIVHFDNFNVTGIS